MPVPVHAYAGWAFKPKTVNATTTMTIEVEDPLGDPVVGASVTLIVNGHSVAKGGAQAPKTVKNASEGTATVTVSFATSSVTSSASGNLDFRMTVTKGTLWAREAGYIYRNKTNHWLVVLEPMESAKGSAEQRWKQRTRYPMAKRSRRERLDDLSYGLNKTNKFLKGMKLVFHFQEAGVSKQLDDVIRTLVGVSEAADKKAFSEVSKIFEQNWRQHKTYKVLKKGTIALTVVTGLYDFLDAVEEDDWTRANIAFIDTSAALISTAVPVLAPAYLGIHIGIGLAKLMVAAVSGDVDLNVADAVYRQRHLPMLNHVGSCPAFAGNAQYRLQREQGEWRAVRYDFKDPILPGLAFDERHEAEGRRVKGALILVNSNGDRVLIPRKDMNKDRLEQMYKKVQLNKGKL